jgi:hypothetical protein
MTPPKITPNQSLPPTFSCERRSEPVVPAELPKAEGVPVFELAYPPLVKSPIQPYSPFANPFDPTRYKLPPNWQPKRADIDPDKKFIAVDAKDFSADSISPISELFPDQDPWLKAIIHLLNQVKRADLDMYNLSVNRGTKLHRFSEYAPKDKPLRPANLEVQENTTAYVRGEIRPVQGQPDSLITRWVIRYDKPLLHESGLEIMGFSAADAPDIKYEKDFKDWQAVRDISGGDLDYENPQQTGEPLQTPFNSVAPPLPEGHRDWMIAFNPVEDTLWHSIKAAGGFGKLDLIEDIPLLGVLFKGPIDKGRGKLYLWAFNPTLGFNSHLSKSKCEELRQSLHPDPNQLERCNTRPNTMPRKPGALLDFFSPIFDSYRNGLLKHAASYYNPNSDYIGGFVERGEKLLQWAQQKLGHSYSQPEQACEELKGLWKQDSCLLPLPKSYGVIQWVNQARCEDQKGRWKENHCLLPQPNACGDTLWVEKAEEQWPPPIGRQPIPRNASQLERINGVLRLFGLPEIEESRGSIIDWGSMDLRHDPQRLRRMAAKPYIVAHFQMNPDRLLLPIGELAVDAKTDLKVEYLVKPAEVPDLGHPGQTKWEAQIGLRVTLKPLKLTKTDLKIMGFHIKADALEADKVQVEIPNIVGMADTQPETRQPITTKIIGGRAQGLHLTDQQGDVDIAMAQATIKELDFHYDYPNLLFGSKEDKQNKLFDENKQNERLERLCRNQAVDCSQEDNPCHEPNWHASFKGLKGTGLRVGVPQIKGLDVAEFKIPTVEVSQRFKTQREETVSDVLTVDIPALESKGSMDLDLKEKQESGGKGDVVHLEGGSVLKNVHLTSHFYGDHSLLNASLDLSGTIEKATLSKEKLGEISFTTKTNGHPIKPLSGHIGLEINNPAKLDFQVERPKGPPPKFDLDLDLPYVGLESKGALTIAPGAATIRNGKVKLVLGSKITGTIEGQLNLQDASYQHQKKQPLEMGRMDMFPALKQAHARGNFKFQIFEDGFSFSNPLYQPEDPNHERLSLGFSIDGTQLHHCPSFPEGPLKEITKGPLFETNFHLDRGQVEMQDFGAFEMHNLTVDGEAKPTLTHLESGPVFLGQIEGGGSVWINTLLFGWDKISIPILGGTLTAEDSHLPDARALTSHLPEAHKKKLREDLAAGDFIFVAGIKFNRFEGGWKTEARDAIINLHEQGGLHQFAMARYPQITFGMKGEKFIPPRLIDFLEDIFLDASMRGGRIHNFTSDPWRRALKGEKK